MSFKNLEERFNATVNDLYAAAQNKYEDGRKSDGINDDPLITRRVEDGYWGFGESRSVPIRSAALDVQRLTKFYVSQRGLLAYGKQQLLQTGNTFEFTRLLNPTFVLGNAVPFLHVRRHLTPRLSLSSLTSLVGRTDASSADVRKWGQMQVGSYEKLKNYEQPQFISALGLSSEQTEGQGNNASVSLGSRFLNKLKSELRALNPFNATRNIGEEFNYDWYATRPELAENSIVSIVNKANQKYQTTTDEFFKELTEGVPSYKTRDEYQPFLKYFTQPRGQIGVITTRNDLVDPNSNAKNLSLNADGTRKKLRYIKDPLNIESPTAGNVLERYEKLHATDGIDYKDDAVIVSFALGNNDHVQFRSFIRDLNQTATPEYKTYQYIGRIERFVYYITVEREISFKLDLLAFSKDELKLVWERINYLTSMVFPYGITRGILQPNIVRMTIGNVYVNQPGYITSFNVNFNEVTESWDIDEEVPIGATVNMSFKLIEKATKTANSGFYGINEGTRVPPTPAEIQTPAEPQFIAPTLDTLNTSELNRQIAPITPPPPFPPPPSS